MTEPQVLAAVAALPPRCKAIVTLYYLEGLNEREIAATLSVSEQTVRAEHAGAVAAMRSVLCVRGET